MHFLNDKEVVINQLWPQKRERKKNDQMTGAFDISDTAESLGRISSCSVHPTMYHLFVAVEKSPPNAFIWCTSHAGGDWKHSARISWDHQYKIEFGIAVSCLPGAGWANVLHHDHWLQLLFSRQSNFWYLE
jgi:hypothetical protein